MVEIDVKDDFLLKKEVLPCKNVNFVHKGKYPKIQRKIGHTFVFKTCVKFCMKISFVFSDIFLYKQN